jgi:hypothetical protein
MSGVWRLAPGRWAAVVALVVAAGSLAGCTGATAPSGVASPSTPAPAATPAMAIQPVLVSTQAWPGRNRILLTVEDAANQPLTGPDLAVRATFHELIDGASPTAIAAVGTFVRVVPGGRGLIELDVDLPRAGRWRLDLEATLPGGSPLTGWTELEVHPDGATPPIGSPAPAVATPTVRDVGGDFARITSDPIPNPSLYWLSAAEALAAGKPFVLVLDSFRFKETQACGGALGLVHHLGQTFPTIAFINVEPYRTTFANGALSLDPPGGPGRLAPWSEAWGIEAAPWVFVVDGEGIVRAKFSGILGTEELRLALRAIAGWSPTAATPIAPRRGQG